PQKTDIGPKGAVRLDGRRTNCHQLMLVELASDYDNLNQWVFGQGQRNWWAVRDHGGTKIRWQSLCYLQERRAAIKNDHLILADEPDSRLDRKSTRLNSSHVKISYA